MSTTFQRPDDKRVGYTTEVTLHLDHESGRKPFVSIKKIGVSKMEEG